MYIYVTQVKQGDGFSIRAFWTKAAAVKAVKTAQAAMYLQMEHDKNHGKHVDADGFGAYCTADPDAKNAKEKVTEDGDEGYYVTVYGKDGELYYRKLAGYVKKTVIEC